MEEQLEKRKKFLINTAYWAAVAALVIFGVRFGFRALTPFLIGLVVAMILQPVITFFTKKCRIRHKISAIFTVLLFYCTIGVLLVFLVLQLITLAQNLVEELPGYYTNRFVPALSSFFEKLETLVLRYFPDLSPRIDETVAEVTATAGATISKFSMTVLSGAAGAATKVPKILLNVVITVVSSFFIAVDYSDITRFILRQMPSHTRVLVLRVKNELGTTVGMYLKSYSLIMFWTFLELWVGLAVIGIDQAGLIAIVVAVFDILPVIGSGLVVVPWAIISFIVGNVGQGIGLLILVAIMTVVRNIIEPRIVGEQVGLPAIVTLLAMVLGTFIFGPVGLLGFPVAVAIIKKLNDQGTIHLYRDVPEGDEPKKKDPLTRIIEWIRSKKKK